MPYNVNPGEIWDCCGITVIAIKKFSDNFPETLELLARCVGGALEEAKSLIEEKYHSAICETWGGSRAIASISVVEGVCTEIDCEAIRKKNIEDRSTEASKAKVAAEKAEYERLRMKFEPVAMREVKIPRKSDGGFDGDCG